MIWLTTILNKAGKYLQSVENVVNSKLNAELAHLKPKTGAIRSEQVGNGVSGVHISLAEISSRLCVE